MRSKLRLRVILPVVALGLLGIGVGAFAFSGAPVESVAAPKAQAAHSEPAAAEAANPEDRPPSTSTGNAASGASAGAQLARALKRHPVVVVLLYAPESAVDSLATLEARAGAGEGGAGFLAVDVSDSSAVESLVTSYGVRAAPAVLVFARGPRVVTRIDGFADRETVAQAAENARA